MLLKYAKKVSEQNISKNLELYVIFPASPNPAKIHKNWVNLLKFLAVHITKAVRFSETKQIKTFLQFWMSAPVKTSMAWFSRTLLNMLAKQI